MAGTSEAKITYVRPSHVESGLLGRGWHWDVYAAAAVCGGSPLNIGGGATPAKKYWQS